MFLRMLFGLTFQNRLLLRKQKICGWMRQMEMLSSVSAT